MAQGFGVLGGATFAKINLGADEFLNRKFDEKLEPAVGVFVTLPLHQHLSLEPELMASVKGTYLNFDALQENIRLTYLELPVLLRYTPPSDSPLSWLRLLGGPYGAYLLDARSQSREATRTTNLNEVFQTFDLGWMVGLGAHAGGFDLDVRYSGSLVDIAVRPDLNLGLSPNPDVTYRNRAFVFLVRRQLR